MGVGGGGRGFTGMSVQNGSKPLNILSAFLRIWLES